MHAYYTVALINNYIHMPLFLQQKIMCCTQEGQPGQDALSNQSGQDESSNQLTVVGPSDQPVYT